MTIGRSSQSAYDYMEWVEEKRTEAAKTGALNPFDATMVAQITPGELNGAGHALKFAGDLVTEWLCRYKFKNWEKTESRGLPVSKECKRTRAIEIADKLQNHAHWRTHGRSLKYNDLTGIGLKIVKIDDDEELADLIYRIQTVLRLLFDSTSTFKVFVTEDHVIRKQAVPTKQTNKSNPFDQAAVVEVGIDCQQCGKHYDFYLKLEENNELDKHMSQQGALPLPQNNRLICACGFETDLSGIINEVEAQTGKKVIR
jgi:hypothetical protein